MSYEMDGDRLNPHVLVAKENGIDDNWQKDYTIRNMYDEHKDVTMIQYADIYEDVKTFDDIPSLNLDKIMEEMIHHCLPDPDETIDTLYGQKRNGLWKYYLYELLLEAAVKWL